MSVHKAPSPRLCRERPGSLGALMGCPGVTLELVTTWRGALRTAQERAASSGCPVGADRLEAHERAGVWLEVPTGGATGEIWNADPEPPALLFGRGALLDTATQRVGIVGTRRCSGYGRTVAQQLGEGLAVAGVAVVSGVASGIDCIAQRAALDAGGAVIGVVGSGLDRVYPASNRSLWDDIAQQGTLLSEYPLGTPALRWRFPARNRIIAALCDVLVVVESAESGGSLYTVDEAAERGRPVMAVPGAITSDVSRGTNRLLAEGCSPVCDVGDILLALGWSETDSVPSGALLEPPMPESSLDRRILDELGPAARTVDELVLRTGDGLTEVAASLGRLELSGWATETAGWWERTR